MAVTQPFVEGGWTTYVVLFFSLVTHAIAIGALIAAFGSKSRGVVIGMGVAALMFATLTVFAGLAGYGLAMRTIDDALLYAAPEYVEEMRARGQSEAMWNVWCGLGGAALPLLLSGGAIVRGLFTRSDAARA